MKTTIEGIYVAGDTAGVEGASIAIEERRLARDSCLLCAPDHLNSSVTGQN